MFGRYLSIRSCSAWPPGVFCQVLWLWSSGMLGVGCGEQWQLGSKQTYKALPGGPRRNLFRWKGTDREIIKTQSRRHTSSRFPAKRGSKTRTSPQTPGPWPKCREYYLEHPDFFWHRGAFGNPLFGRDFRPCPPCPPRHLPPKTECAGVLKYI